MAALVTSHVSQKYMACSSSCQVAAYTRPQSSRISLPVHRRPRLTTSSPTFLSAARIHTTFSKSTYPVVRQRSFRQSHDFPLAARASSVQKETGVQESRDSSWKLPLAIAAAVTCGGQGVVANAVVLNPAYGQTASFLDNSVQFLYLGALLALLASGSFLVVRQVLVRRELENAAKELQERVRSGQASSEEYFELGAVMLRKKFYLMANRYLEQAIKKWEGEEQDLAQVHNALGFSYFSEDSMEKAVAQYQKAVKLQPAYVTAWNNLGDALEKKKDLPGALKAYEEALSYEPSNRVASARRGALKDKVRLLSIGRKEGSL